MPTDVPECPFCEIACQGEPDAREVYRDKRAVAFFPLEPATLGHTLVIPRHHVPDIWSLEEDAATWLAHVTFRLARVMRHALQPEGLNIIQSNGAAATQTVRHLHIHVVPRWHDDAIGRIWPPESTYSEMDKDDVWEILRQAGQAEMHGE